MCARDEIDRFRGCLLGLAVGDAVGTTVDGSQVAGAFYGESGIPERWCERLVMHDEIRSLADQLCSASRQQ